MTAGLGRGLALAGTGVALGLALVAALFGTGDLLKHVRGIVAPGETSRPVADLPRGETPSDKPLAKTDKPQAETGDRAAIDPGKAPLAAPDQSPQGETRRDSPSAGGPGSSPAGEEKAPSLDIIRVEPTGDAVIAGRGAPNASVEILRDDTAIARAKADESGAFAIDGMSLPPGNSELTLRSTAPDGKTTQGKVSAVVVVDKDRKAQPLVAVSEPDKPTRVLSQPEAPTGAKTAENGNAGTNPGADPAKTAEREGEKPSVPAKTTERESGNASDAAKSAERERSEAEKKADSAPPRREAALPKTEADRPAAEATPVKIVSVDAQEGGRLYVAGQGAAWASLRLYLNDTLVASGRSGADGRIAFTIGRGVKPGGYQIRIDQVEAESGKVRQRAQVGFTFPVQLAAKEPPKEPAKQPLRTASKEPPAAPARPLPETIPDAAAKSVTEPGPRATAPGSADETKVEKKSEEGKGDSKSAGSASSAPPSPSGAPSMATGAARPDAAKPSRDSDERMAEALAPTLPSIAKPPVAEPKAPVDTPSPAASGQGAAEPSPAAKPSQRAETPPSDVPAPGPATSSPIEKPGAVFVPEIETATIIRGDNLWRISRRSYGDGKRYTVIYDANRDQIRDPNLIYPGQIFVMPKDNPAADRQGANRG